MWTDLDLIATVLISSSHENEIVTEYRWFGGGGLRRRINLVLVAVLVLVVLVVLAVVLVLMVLVALVVLVVLVVLVAVALALAVLVLSGLWCVVGGVGDGVGVGSVLVGLLMGDGGVLMFVGF